MPSNTKKHGIATVKKITGTCELFSNFGPMVCPLCGVTVPKSTPHSCEKKE
jgi:hypothetical protein